MTQVHARPLSVWKTAIRKAKRRAYAQSKYHHVVGFKDTRPFPVRLGKPSTAAMVEAYEKAKAFNIKHGIRQGRMPRKSRRSQKTVTLPTLNF